MSSVIRARIDKLRLHKSVAASEAALPYLMLAVLAGSTLAVQREREVALLVEVSLYVSVAAWMLGMYTLNSAWRTQPRHMTVFVAGLLLLTGLITLGDAWFGFFLAVCFGFGRELLPWPKPMAVAAACAVIGAFSQTENTHIALPLHLMDFFIALTIDMLLFSSLMWLMHEREQQIEQHCGSPTPCGRT
jgi:hypothetical protein